VYIAIEGWEASGKTTQTRLLAARLREHCGTEVADTRAPGGSPLAERLRELLICYDDGIAPKPEYLMFAACAALHAAAVREALERGAHVVTDRCPITSAIAYQGFGRGFGREIASTGYRWAADGLRPDITVCLHQPWKSALARFCVRHVIDGGDRIESDGIEFHRRVHNGYSVLSEEGSRSARWATVDASSCIDDVAEAVWSAVVGRLTV